MTGLQTDRQTDGQAVGQTDGQTERLKNKKFKNETYNVCIKQWPFIIQMSGFDSPVFPVFVDDPHLDDVLGSRIEMPVDIK